MLKENVFLFGNNNFDVLLPLWPSWSCSATTVGVAGCFFISLVVPYSHPPGQYTSPGQSTGPRPPHSWPSLHNQHGQKKRSSSKRKLFLGPSPARPGAPLSWISPFSTLKMGCEKAFMGPFAWLASCCSTNYLFKQDQKRCCCWNGKLFSRRSRFELEDGFVQATHRSGRLGQNSL